MSTTVSIGSAAPAGLPTQGPPRGFFRYHGIWAPGVRLFRRISFTAKAFLLLTVMVMPLLAVIGWLAWSAGGIGWVPALVVACALLFGVYLFRCFYLVMKGGLREVSAHLKAMTDGDLTTSPKPWGADEAASLMLDLSTMQQSLRRIVTQVREASQNLNTASDEIASAAMDLSHRTEQSSSHLEQSNNAMSAIATAVDSVSQNTAQAASVAEHNARIAHRGSEVITQAVDTMGGIDASSRQITEIIAVIDGIAFQTNILALNAAVEAARAGEAGRGFAVVAGEVRSLASRSAEAAKQVRQLITGSVEQVRSGTVVVQDAGRIMRELVDSAGTMRTLLAEIAQASADNSSALGRIGEAIHELDQMTQQNAALVEETAASASGMKARSGDLTTAVAAFKISADSSAMTRKRLSEDITASPQITIPELARLKSAGYRSIICNRPDNEGPGQTRFADIEKAARELGLQARHLPIEPGKATPADGQQFAQLLRDLPRPILAYCRTGMRSTALWKLANPGVKPLEG